jgi:chitinase
MQSTPWRRWAFILVIGTALGATEQGRAQSREQGKAQARPLDIVAYYAGRNTMMDSFPVEKLTHIIFSFCHLKGDTLSVMNANDTLRIRHMVALKSRNPNLKVMVSLGGWGGCKTCSDVFKDKKKRKFFVKSTRHLLEYFQADGIDLDWEYPALANVPGYPYAPEDVANFTDLVRRLRHTLGKRYEISFAAGGFTAYLLKSIEWKKVYPLVNRINLMTYDLVNGYDTTSGHHTALYSSPGHPESIDHAVRLLRDSFGVPPVKIAIGAAFYARVFEGMDSVDNGLYRHGHFKFGVDYRNFSQRFPVDSGFVYHWDTVARAPFYYNKLQKLFVTFDDTMSIRLKTQYAIQNHLGGVMFWELSGDTYEDGLLDVIYDERKRLSSN